MDVPAAKKKAPLLSLSTKSRKKVGSGQSIPPPGAAKLTTDCPKLLYEAKLSKLVWHKGPVAETAIPFPDCAGTAIRLLFRSAPLFPAALTTRVPEAVAWFTARFNAESSVPSP